MSTIEDWVNERRPEPWPGRVRRFADDKGVDATALYQRRSADVEATGHEPPSQTKFGEALQAVEGITRKRIPTGYVYFGLTVETRQERAEAAVQRRLFSAAMDARADEEWAQRWDAHRMKDAMQGIGRDDCPHPQPPEVVAGLAEVEAAIAPLIPDAVEAHYGPWLRWQPGDPDPGVAIYRAEDEAERAEVAERLAVMEAEDAAEAAKLREPYDAVYATWRAAQDAIVSPVTRCVARTCEDETHWTLPERATVRSTHPVDPDAKVLTYPMVVVFRGGGHTDWFNLPENAAHRESVAAARAIELPMRVTPPRNYTREQEYRRLRAKLAQLDSSLAATDTREPVTASSGDDAFADY